MPPLGFAEQGADQPVEQIDGLVGQPGGEIYANRYQCRVPALAFKDAMTRARPTILEPVMNVEVYAPSDFAGDLMGDLNGRRGRIAGMDTRGAMTIIKAQVPMAEMLTYEQHLTSATGGRGSYHMEYSHYDEVPAQQQAKIITTAKAERAGVEVEES